MEATMTMRTIEIDFEVHKAIELERRSFDEAPDTALRRLLGIAPAEAEENSKPGATPAPSPAGRPWVGKGHSAGLTLPHGTELQMDYNGQRFMGRVDNGVIMFEGQNFTSPSGAADELCRTKDGRKTSLNGKELISARLRGETDWVLLKTLERRMRKETA